MRAKKLLATFLTICMIVSSIPMATFMMVSADGNFTYKMVKLTDYTKSQKSSTDATSINKENTSEPDGGNLSTTNGSVAVYDVDFGADGYDAVQIFYAGRYDQNRVPMSAHIQVYLGDYMSDSASCTLLADVNVPPYSTGWDARCFSEIVALSESLTGQKTISLLFIGEDGYLAVSNARQMFFFQGTSDQNLKDYVDASGSLAVSGSYTKTSSDDEGVGQIFNGYTDSKFGITWNSGSDVVVYYSTYVPVQIDYYTYLTANDDEVRDPKTWKLYGSTDGQSYTEIDSVSDFAAYSTRNAFSGDFFQVDNPGSYQYYKLVISAFKGTDTSLYCQFSEFSMFGSAAISASDAEAIKGVFNDIKAISAQTALSNEWYTAIETAKSAYDALSLANQAYVTNVAALNAAININNANQNVGSDFASAIYSLIAKVDSIYVGMYNHTDELIQSTQTTYDDLCATYTQATVDTYLTNKAKLDGAMDAYNTYMNNYQITVTGTGTTSSYPWTANFSDEDWTASRNAIADDVKYLYMNGVDLGGANGKSYSLGTDEGSIGIQLDNLYSGSGRTTDNAWNPWTQGGRYWSKISTPFSGMAFTRGGYFAIGGYGGDSPIGEPFEMNGKVYQLYFNSIRSYDGTLSVKKMKSNTETVDGDIITVNNDSIYPGSGDYAAEIGNVFRYAVADYNQTNKYTDNYVTGKNIGIPTANAAFGGSSTYYQRFNGPDGIAYIASNDSILSTVTLATSEAGYEDQLETAADQTFFIGNTIASAVETQETSMAALMAKAGDLNFASSTEDTLVFTNGTFTLADGYVQTVTPEELMNQAAAVDTLIDAIGTVTLEPSSLAKIVAAEKALNGLSPDALVYVTKETQLTDARAAYNALVDSKVKMDNSSYANTISGSRPDDSEGYKGALDGNLDTKMYMSTENYADTIWSIDIPVKAVAYGLTTGGDTSKYSDRNPHDVTLYGSVDGESWTQIDQQLDPSLPAADTTEKVFYINSPEVYQYYKIAFNSVTTGTVQLAEISLYTAADYSGVIDAMQSVPADLSGYTPDSVNTLNTALSSVVYGVADQTQVDGYASAINNAITALEVQLADYSGVDTAKAAVPADLSIYTDSTVATLQNVLDGIDYNLLPADQAIVDGYATAIQEAVAGLVEKAIEMNIQITNAMVTEVQDATGKYNLTWNASIVPGTNSSVADINQSGIVFKEYGVFYATGDDVLADYQNANPDNIRKKVFDSGDDIVVYTQFSFRLKNVNESSIRAAMFYVEYEYKGQTYMVFSSIDEATATIIAG